MLRITLPFDLAGERPSIADIALHPCTHAADEGGFDLARFAAVRAWLGRVRSPHGHVPITVTAHVV